MSFIGVAAGIGAASTIYGVGKSISQGSQASAIDKANVRGTYTIPDEYKQNVAMANHMAQIGMPQQQYDNQQNNIGRNQAGALASLGNSANPGANLASIVRGGNDATGQLNAQDAQMRQGNQRFAIGQNAQLGQQELAQQQYNKFDKFTEQFNKSAALRGAAGQNMQNAVNGASGMATNLASIQAGGQGGQTMGDATGRGQIYGGSTPGSGGITPVNYGNIGYNNQINRQPMGMNRYNYGSQWGLE